MPGAESGEEDHAWRGVEASVHSEVKGIGLRGIEQ
jgi:hypothetical protein